MLQGDRQRGRTGSVSSYVQPAAHSTGGAGSAPRATSAQASSRCPFAAATHRAVAPACNAMQGGMSAHGRAGRHALSAGSPNLTPQSSHRLRWRLAGRRACPSLQPCTLHLAPPAGGCRWTNVRAARASHACGRMRGRSGGCARVRGPRATWKLRLAGCREPQLEAGQRQRRRYRGKHASLA